MKQFFKIGFLFACIFASKNIAAQFYKTYTDPGSPGASVSFEAITEQTDAAKNFYIGGHIADTITIFKMNASGIVLATYKLKAGVINTRIDAVMIDQSGSYLVMIGNVQTAGLVQGFILKFDITTNTLVWFAQTNTNNKITFFDVADRNTSSSFYYVSGSTAITNTALLMEVNKGTGALNIGTNYQVNGLEDPIAIQIVGSKLYTTGRYALGGSTNGFRYCFSRFNANNYNHLGSNYYAVQKWPTATARMYSSDILVSGSNTVIIGSGDDNNINDAFRTLHINKVKTSNGAIVWSKKLDITTTGSDGNLTEVRQDNAGNYTVMGFTKTATSGTLNGKAFLLSVKASNGNILWNHRFNLYRRAANNAGGYEYGFAIYGSNLYAVGQDAISGITKGVLIKVNATTGYLSNAASLCYDSLSINTSNYTFSDTVGITTLNPNYKTKNQAVQLSQTSMKDSLVCGTVPLCNCTFNNIVDGGGIFSQTFNCDDTIFMSCNTSYFFRPNLVCGSTPAYISNVTLQDGGGNTPPWAITFISNMGSGLLNIPPSTSGLYYIKYYLGSGGVVCDSCTYILNISCCPGCLVKNNVAHAIQFKVSPNPFTNSFHIDGLKNELAEIDILSIEGRPLAHYTNIRNGNSFGSTLQKGIYLLRLKSTNGLVQSIQLIKN